MSLRAAGDDAGADDGGRCAECEARAAAGPCAACHAMICGDCGVLTKDPESRKVICLSCANLVAASDRAPRAATAPLYKVIAVAVLIAFGAAAIALAF